MVPFTAQIVSFAAGLSKRRCAARILGINSLVLNCLVVLCESDRPRRRRVGSVMGLIACMYRPGAPGKRFAGSLKTWRKPARQCLTSP